MSYETLAEITTKRRSIRKFTDEPVSREDVEKIIRIGMQAPSGFNSQPWEMVVVDDKALRDEVAGYILDGLGGSPTSRGFATAPVFIIVYGDERTRKFGPAARRDNEKWWDFTLNSSLCSAFMSMQFAVASLGLGSMWVSSFRNPEADRRARELLNIPSHLRLFEMMAVGHPAIEGGKKKMREVSEVIHYNKADNYRTDEEVDNWF